MTTKLYRTGESAVTIADPEGPSYKKIRVRIASQERSLDGTMTQQRVANKWRWELEWLGLSESEYATLFAELNRTVAMTFEPPDGGSHSVVIVGDPEIVATGFWYDVRAVLEEV